MVDIVNVSYVLVIPPFLINPTKYSYYSGGRLLENKQASYRKNFR